MFPLLLYNLCRRSGSQDGRQMEPHLNPLHVLGSEAVVFTGATRDSGANHGRAALLPTWEVHRGAITCLIIFRASVQLRANIY